MFTHYHSIWLTQTSYFLLCAFWNLTGVIQIHHGLPSIGPTASLPLALILCGIPILLAALLKRHNWSAYLILTLLSLLSGLSAIYGGLTQDPSLWPSHFWRLAGIALNTMPIFFTALLVRRYQVIKRLSHQPC